MDDEVARQCMGLLYASRWVHKLDTIAAMREATLALLRARRAAGRSGHPYYWGSFIPTGDWR